MLSPLRDGVGVRRDRDLDVGLAVGGGELHEEGVAAAVVGPLGGADRGEVGRAGEAGDVDIPLRVDRQAVPLGLVVGAPQEGAAEERRIARFRDIEPRDEGRLAARERLDRILGREVRRRRRPGHDGLAVRVDHDGVGDVRLAAAEIGAVDERGGARLGRVVDREESVSDRLERVGIVAVVRTLERGGGRAEVRGSGAADDVGTPLGVHRDRVGGGSLAAADDRRVEEAVGPRRRVDLGEEAHGGGGLRRLIGAGRRREVRPRRADGAAVGRRADDVEIPLGVDGDRLAEVFVARSAQERRVDQAPAVGRELGHEGVGGEAEEVGHQGVGGRREGRGGGRPRDHGPALGVDDEGVDLVPHVGEVAAVAAEIGRVDQARAGRVQLGDEADRVADRPPGRRLEGAGRGREGAGRRDAADDGLPLAVDADAPAHVVAGAAEVGDVGERLAVGRELGHERVGRDRAEDRLRAAVGGGVDRARVRRVDRDLRDERGGQVGGGVRAAAVGALEHPLGSGGHVDRRRAARADGDLVDEAVRRQARRDVGPAHAAVGRLLDREHRGDVERPRVGRVHNQVHDRELAARHRQARGDHRLAAVGALVDAPRRVVGEGPLGDPVIERVGVGRVDHQRRHEPAHRPDRREGRPAVGRPEELDSPVDRVDHVRVARRHGDGGVGEAVVHQAVVGEGGPVSAAVGRLEHEGAGRGVKRARVDGVDRQIR